jgi:hypothetical protein
MCTAFGSGTAERTKFEGAELRWLSANSVCSVVRELGLDLLRERVVGDCGVAFRALDNPVDQRIVAA